MARAVKGGFGVELIGDRQTIRKLKRMSDIATRRIMRPAVTKALVPINKAAKRKAPVETGLLKKSIGTRVKTYARAGIVWGGVAPRSGYKTVDEDGRSRDPVNYAHLVELGHMAYGNVYIPARPFLRPAIDTQRSKALAIVRTMVKVGIEKEARRR